MSVRRSLGWTTIGQALLFVTQIASQVVISRWLNPYLVGIAAIAYSISDFVNLMQTFGLRNFLIRETDLGKDVIRTTFTVNFAMSLVTAAIIELIAVFGAIFYHEPGVGRVLTVIAFVPIVSAFELVPGALLQRNMQFGALAIANVTKAISATAVTIVLILMGDSYMSLGWGTLVGMTISAAVTSALGWRYVHWRPGFADWRRVTTFGTHMLGIGGASTAAMKAVDLSLGKILGLAGFGLYSRAAALNGVLWTNIHSVFTKVVFSAMAEERRKTGSIRSIYLHTVDMITATLWPAFLGMAIFSGPIVNVLYGPKWLAAAPVLAVFSLASICLTSITMTWEVFVVCQRTGQQTRIEIIRSVVALGLITGGAMFGVVGAAGGRIADALFAIGMYRRPLGELTETSLREIGTILGRNASLTLVTVSPAAIMMALHHWDPRVPLPLVMAGALASVVLWLAVGTLINARLRAEMVMVFKRVAPSFHRMC